MRSRCVHGSPAVSSCARTYSGQRPGRTSGSPHRLSPGCAGYPGDRRRVGLPARRSLVTLVLAHAWPTESVGRRGVPLGGRDLAADSRNRRHAGSAAASSLHLGCAAVNAQVECRAAGVATAAVTGRLHPGRWGGVSADLSRTWRRSAADLACT